MKIKSSNTDIDKARDFLTSKRGLTQFKEWIKALRSGQYSQTDGRLQHGESFCCLGVACKELVPWKDLRSFRGVISSGHPTDQPASPKWLKDIDGDFAKRSVRADVERVEPIISIVNMNDELKLSFDEIADCLEAVYLHGAWDMPPKKRKAK